eukprot:CAMPEP_0184335368 /NCGR_PEP_ID=MMETSP1089-20130417/3939_1 /TAXON_ID=38269 ORGANISM="Gloeochaete wittrockiana, Strain SAG46.84" /NCGR_SAMPLE_ID=MMETSP1089 /ASSEMBLY_ACC=CAM_ASM_000445 /LENGTH=504 /DNA_ID=CAMNT_0026659987 /DNA_START=67 /DNA_END=1581 /DNA_ORIENTATION=-
MWAKEKEETRAKDFKKGFDLSESQKRKQDSRTELRRQKREEGIETKRAYQPEEPCESTFEVQLSELPTYVEIVMRGQSEHLLQAVEAIRKLLAIAVKPPIDDVLRSGVVPHLINLLASPNPKLQFEACWAITNIASGSSAQTNAIVDLGAVPNIVGLLSSFDIQVRDQAVWALGNIAGDSARCRDIVLSQNYILDRVIALVQPSIKSTVRRNAAWTISNLCRGKPSPDIRLVAPLIPVLGELLNSDDAKIIGDSLWAISYVTDGNPHYISAVIEARAMKRIVELLLHQNPGIQTPALRIIGNAVTGDDVQTTHVIQCGALPCLRELIKMSRKTTLKEICWTISNITAGTQIQVQHVLENGIVPLLIEMLDNADFDVKKEAAWALANSTSSGSPDQISALVNLGCIPPLCELLSCPDLRVINVALEGLTNILTVGNKIFEGRHNEFCDLIDQCGGVEKIEQLQDHPTKAIYLKAFNIVDKFYSDSTDEEGAPANDEELPSGGFNF